MDIEDISDSSVMIAPMLLIVFVENAFKHSKNSTDQTIYIHISCKTWGNQLLFSVVNSYSSESKTIDGYNGLGLVNAKKRLDMLYPGQHHLVIEDSDETYKVMLQLKMK
jgi:LytS/YehU family sensor histidine kinase